MVPNEVLDFAAAVQAVLDTRAAGGHSEYRGLLTVAVFDNDEAPIASQRLREIAPPLLSAGPRKNSCG